MGQLEVAAAVVVAVMPEAARRAAAVAVVLPVAGVVQDRRPVVVAVVAEMLAAAAVQVQGRLLDARTAEEIQQVAVMPAATAHILHPLAQPAEAVLAVHREADLPMGEGCKTEATTTMQAQDTVVRILKVAALIGRVRDLQMAPAMVPITMPKTSGALN